MIQQSSQKNLSRKMVIIEHFLCNVRLKNGKKTVSVILKRLFLELLFNQLITCVFLGGIAEFDDEDIEKISHFDR